MSATVELKGLLQTFHRRLAEALDRQPEPVEVPVPGGEAVQLLRPAQRRGDPVPAGEQLLGELPAEPREAPVTNHVVAPVSADMPPSLSGPGGTIQPQGRAHIG